MFNQKIKIEVYWSKCKHFDGGDQFRFDPSFVSQQKSSKSLWADKDIHYQISGRATFGMITEKDFRYFFFGTESVAENKISIRRSINWKFV